MSEDERPPAAIFADLLQDQEREGRVFEDADGAGRALLVGFVVLSEWMDENGFRWLSNLSGNGEGRSIPEWQVQGYLHNALHHPEDFGHADDEDA